MKFMVLLTRGEWQESGSREERERVFGGIQEWWGNLAASGQMVEGHQLEHPRTATTVIVEDGQSLLVDRPLI
ncbi:MAG: hypothetical protein ACRDHX_16835 [Chloroflexota bacterium]